jgi:hypothetical protein
MGSRPGEERAVTIMQGAVSRQPCTEEITLAGSPNGEAVVEVIEDEGRSHVFQYRYRNAVLAEATTLRALARLVVSR